MLVLGGMLNGLSTVRRIKLYISQSYKMSSRNFDTIVYNVQTLIMMFSIMAEEQGFVVRSFVIVGLNNNIKTVRCARCTTDYSYVIGQGCC